MSRPLIMHPAPQGSAEWLRARAGVITASEFDKIITSKTRKASAQRTPYLCRVAGEGLLGCCEELFESLAMRRGGDLEPEAREAYELATGISVTEAGLCYLDESRRVACSPDGLCGNDGGLELKCPGIAKHVEYLIGGGCPDEYFHQVQGCLYVTGRVWWDFMSYYPGLPLFLARCLPDPDYHAALAEALTGAVDELDTIIARLRDMQGGGE